MVGDRSKFQAGRSQMREVSHLLVDVPWFLYWHDGMKARWQLVLTSGQLEPYLTRGRFLHCRRSTIKRSEGRSTTSRLLCWHDITCRMQLFASDISNHAVSELHNTVKSQLQNEVIPTSSHGIVTGTTQQIRHNTVNTSDTNLTYAEKVTQP